MEGNLIDNQAKKILKTKTTVIAKAVILPKDGVRVEITLIQLKNPRAQHVVMY